MDTIEKIVKVLEANKNVAWSLKAYYDANGKRELAERYFGEWLAFDEALAMLTDEEKAEDYYAIWAARKEAANNENH